MISAIKVLNSVSPATNSTTATTDVSVSSDGIVNIASVETVDAYNVKGVSVTVPRAEVSGVITITPTNATATLAEYNFYINAFSMTTGLPKVLNVSFRSAASPDATSVCNQARAIINADTDLSVIASGTTTIVLTAKPTQPFFVVGGTSANVDSYSSITATIFTGLSATNGTAGVSVRGSVAYLQNKYAYSANGNALNYNELALLTSGYYYTEVVISYISTTPSGSGAFKGEISTLEAVVLVRFDTGATTASTTNYNDLLGSYGTITGLAAGYRVIPAAITGTAGSNTSNVQTMTSGVLGTEDVVSGDFIVGDTGSVATNIRKVISVLSQTTFLTTTATAITGSGFRVFKWRALPL